MIPLMRRIAGMDYSLTNCGIAIATQRVNGSVAMNTTTVRSTGKLKDSLPARRQRLLAFTEHVVDAVGVCDFIVLEGVIPTKGPTLDRYGGLWFILNALMAREIPIAVCSPDSMKLAMTGKTARQLGADQSKWAVANAVRKLWPDLDVANEHESDAAGLCHLGAVALEWNVSTLERHKQVRWTEWPEFGPEMRVVS